MAVTEEDTRVFECPQCEESNTYRPFHGPDRYGKWTYKCEKSGRTCTENRLAREIHRKD